MPKQFFISVIGAGRVGQTLGRLWHNQGYTIESVVCRKLTSAKRAVRFIGAGKPNPKSLSKSDLFLLSVPDDELQNSVALLQQHFTDLKGSAVLHTSGSLSSSILQPLQKIGAPVGSMHPLLSFSSPELAVDQVAGGFFCVEGDNPATAIAKRLIKSIGAQPFEIRSSDKSVYHAAAVMASPHLTSLLSLSIELLMGCGLTEKKSGDVLLPLINTTISNLSKQGAATALTGPVKRADLSTIERNLDALTTANPLAEQVYRLLSLQGVKLTEQSGMPDEKLSGIVRRLKKKKA
jgi:predicted short-subunit dehydrogenase-like oxidoreductase (DUF2520 family)